MKKTFNDVADVKGYHIHIYFQPGTETSGKAAALANAINEQFWETINEKLVYNRAVGPHSAPNHALHITRRGFGLIVPWLQLNSTGLSVLIHPETGDEVKDHLDRSMWIGTPVAYNMAFFEAEKARQAAPRPGPKP